MNVSAMNPRMWAILTCLLFALPRTNRAADIGTAFTYQGRLVKDGTPVNDTCTLTFGLWEVAAGGNQKGTSPQGPDVILVTDGLFTTSLNFGPTGVDGTGRCFEITVQRPGDATAMTLTPRKELTAMPHTPALRNFQVKPAGPDTSAYSGPNTLGG